jgi:hypothetical protein
MNLECHTFLDAFKRYISIILEINVSKCIVND